MSLPVIDQKPDLTRLDLSAPSDPPEGVAPGPSAQTQEGSAAHPYTILVVDDEESILRSVQRLLRRQYNILTTASVQEAFALLEQHPIHVVMSDQRMPTMTGVEFLTFVKECYPDCIRILFTGYTDTQSAIEAINSGQVYCYIAKPWEPDNLRLIIAQAVERYELLRERRVLTLKLQEANEALERRNRELERANARLQNLDRLKNTFMEVVSHELNTPMAVIQGYTDYLLRELRPDEAQPTGRALRAIQAHTGRLKRITQSIFKVLESNNPRVALQREPTPICDVLRELHHNVEPFLQRRQQRLEIRCDARLVAWIDAPKIGDALLHLVMNAIKFSRDQQTITLRAWAQGDTLHLEVKDQGVGVREGDRREIFEPFFASFDGAHHASGEFEFSKRGVGLGLTIVRRFAELHEGQVTFQPTQPEGATFTLLLPLRGPVMAAPAPPG
jgi:signal transduction histidine kinase